MFHSLRARAVWLGLLAFGCATAPPPADAPATGAPQKSAPSDVARNDRGADERDAAPQSLLDDEKAGFFTHFDVVQQSAAISRDGALYVWGRPHSRLERLTPERMSAAVPMAIAIGSRPACALSTTGELHCVGENPRELVRVGQQRWRSVAVDGGRRRCGVRVDGTLWCWRADGADEPVQVGTRTDWRDAHSSLDDYRSRACFLDETSAPFCMFSASGLPKGALDDAAQCADIGKRRPAVCSEYLLPAGAVADGLVQLRMLGKNVFFGFTDDGVAAITAHPSMSRVLGDSLAVRRWRAASLDRGHACAIDLDGELFCIGANPYGAVGRPEPRTFVDEWVPVLPEQRFSSVRVWSEGKTCALSTEGRLYCWGNNDRGHVGNGGYGRVWTSRRPHRVGLPAAAPTPPTGLREEPWPYGSITTTALTQLSACETVFRPCTAPPLAETAWTEGKSVGQVVLRGLGDGTWRVMRPETVDVSVEPCLREQVAHCGLPEDVAGRLVLAYDHSSPTHVVYSDTSLFHFPAAETDPQRPFDQPQILAPPLPPCASKTNPFRHRSSTLSSFQWSASGFPLDPGTEIRECPLGDEPEHVRFDMRHEQSLVYLGSWSTLADGVPDGHWQQWTEDGRVLVDERYQRGTAMGEHRRWDLVGGRTKSCTYREGVPRGKCRQWQGATFHPGETGWELGTLRLDETWTEDGTPAGVHRRWDATGRLERAVDYDVAPGALAGRARSLSQVSERVFAHPDGGFVHFELDFARNVRAVVVTDPSERPVRRMLTCRGVELLVPSALGGVLSRWDRVPAERWREQPPPTATPSDALWSNYDVTLSVDADGRHAATAVGKAGSNVAGERWTAVGGTEQNGRRHRMKDAKERGFEMAGGAYVHRDRQRCVEPLQLPGLPPHEPAGVGTPWFEIDGRTGPGPRLGATPAVGEEARFAVKWRRYDLVACERLRPTALDADSDDVPARLRDAVQWRVRGEDAVLHSGAVWTFPYAKDSPNRVVATLAEGVQPAPRQCPDGVW